MAHHWESGFMVREPSWHRLEKAVLKESPKNWDDARKEADLLWDVEPEPIYADSPGTGFEQIEGWQSIVRDDTKAVLSVRPTSYETVRNEDFGRVIDTALGLEDDEHVEFEALMSLYGGRQVVALCFFPEPLKMPWDPSATYSYCAFNSRHDGQGGIRALVTNVRVQCANTLRQAEMIDGRANGFTIRHTANWEERLKELQATMVAARGEGKVWEQFAEQLAIWKVTNRRREDYLKRIFPVSDIDGARKRENALRNREQVRMILKSDSTRDIADNGYGLLMATTEWSDHFRQARSADSAVARQLLATEPNKVKAAGVLRTMAGIKI